MANASYQGWMEMLWDHGQIALDGSQEYAYLTTVGRRTGASHRVELWYVAEGNCAYFVAGVDPPIVNGRPDWLRNALVNEGVVVEIGGSICRGRARLLDGDGAAMARKRALSKYMPGRTDARWAQRGLVLQVACQTR